EERYRDLVENATDLILTHDLTGAFLSVNAAFARAIGLGAGEYAGLSVPDIIPQDLRHEFKDYIKAIQRDGKANGIMKIVTRNGEVRYWEYRNTLRTEGVPEPVVRGMARDVTGEVLAKRALRKSEKRYRLLFERNLAGIYRTSIDGRLLDCNDAFARIYGYDSRDEAMQHPVVDFHVSPEAREDFIAAVKKGRTLIGIEIRGRRKDGSLIWLLDSASLVPGEEAELTEIEGMLIDITERKQAEDALRESEELLRSYLENAPDGIYMNDLEGNFLYGNKKCEEITGYRREEMIGKNLLELNLLSEKSLHKAVRLLQDNIEGRSTGPDEIELIRKQGKIIPVEINTSVVQHMGQRVIIGSVRDITERKKIEEELLKADKLESVGILAGGIAHDFNNILTSISGNISLARMHLKPGSKEFDLLSAAETAAIRASGLTRQLLTFAKGGLPVKEIASIQTLIKESSLFVLQGSKVKCEISVAEDLWPVEADTGQISQVISNIVINANQAMPEGGVIRITAENMMPEMISGIPVEPAKYVRISIRDEGIGIAEKHLSKIFDPYFTTKKKGSGLGLAAAYSIIKKHSGHISVDSLPGAGTTFHIYLPASDKYVPVKEEADLVTGSGRILVMDDDKVLREMAEDMLEVLGYESEFAKEGAEAIEMYRKAIESGKPYDAVILDLSIPGGMGGEEAIKILLEIDPEVNAIVFSGYSESPVLSDHLKHGFKGKMAKPFELKTLGKVLNDVLKEPKIVNRG
ncbi:MAG: PAS domain S-box protein, partial [Thermodesulfovibrionales bacterium]|nr:PAS domain S-box protein [Thermodesulfovibrionales bacterium]